MNTPQKEILEYFRVGRELTVIHALRLFHTTELRRIVSRLNKILAPELEIRGEFIGDNKFKTYKLWVNI